MNTSANFAGITGRRGMKAKKIKAAKKVEVGEMPMKGKKGSRRKG